MLLCKVCGEGFQPEEEGQTICEGCPSDSLDFDEDAPAGAQVERTRFLGRDDVLEQSRTKAQVRGMLFAEPVANGEPDPGFSTDVVY